MLELLEFAAVALAGMGVGLVCLYLSHYALEFTSLLAENISANLTGLVLATAFRFVMYKFWVYGPQRKHGYTARQNQPTGQEQRPVASQ